MPQTDDLMIRLNDDDGNMVEEHRFHPGKFLTAEAIAAEKATGLNWTQILYGSQTGNIGCIAALLWLLRKRKDPKLRFADVQFNTGDVEMFDPDLDERYQTEDTDPEPEPVGENEPVGEGKA